MGGKKISQEEAENRFSKRNFQLVDKYIGYDTKVKVKCHCGKIFYTRPHNILHTKKGSKSCGHCNDPNIGDKFGKLIVKEVFPSKNGNCSIKCICECGKFWKGKFKYLSGKYKILSCGHCNDPNINDKFGKLTIIKVIPSSRSGCRVECECECGGKWIGKFSIIQCGRVNSCGCIKSVGENKIRNILNILNIEYEQQKRFDKCKDKRCLPFDFYLPKNNVCIEYQGQQHYKPYLFGPKNDVQEALIKNKQHDQIKKEFCIQHKIKLIEIHYQDSNIIEQILREELL